MRNAYFAVLVALGYLLGLGGMLVTAVRVYLAYQLGLTVEHTVTTLLIGVFSTAALVASTVLIRMCIRGSRERRGFEVLDRR